MRRRLLVATCAVVAFFLLFASFYHHVLRDVLPSDGALRSLKHPRSHSQNYVVTEIFPSDPHLLTTPQQAEAVLFPDWEVLLLLPSYATIAFGDGQDLSCLFRRGETSPARLAGILPSSQRAMFRCQLPPSQRRARTLYAPALTLAPSGRGTSAPARREREMARWNRLAYEAVSTTEDVIVFAKGVNTRQGVNRPAAELRCVFLLDGGPAVASTNVSVSAQEVFRCAHPNPRAISNLGRLRVSIRIKGERRALPSLATYRSRSLSLDNPAPHDKSLVCACTMVSNIAKFLPEWVTYHSAIGVQRFILYDNGSEDELHSVVIQLNESGYNISTVLWPWSKTQEAGFSHCAATHRDSCTWMAFLDVDEYLFSSHWADSAQPNQSMIHSLLPLNPVEERLGQISFACLDFGPSGQRQHPSAGVTQGYTCRLRAEERHKSLVLLEAAAAPNASLVNAVHHFSGIFEEAGWRTKRVSRSFASVYHYKYQAWAEFRAKFRRRVSAYVADWRDEVNPGSRDRTPGLGFEPVEPEGWEWRFCEVNDTSLMEVTRSWFGVEGPGGKHKLAWEA